MKRMVVAAVFLSTIVASSSTVAQGKGDDASTQSSKLRPPTYSPGQAQEMPEQIVRQRRAIERKERLKQREVARLYRIMEMEGDEFSKEKYDSYRKRLHGGATFVVLGGIAMISSALVGLSAAFSGWGYSGHGNDCSEDNACADETDEYETKRRAAVGLMAGGIVGIAVGAPLIVSGRRGKNRQDYLKRKDRILATMSTIRVGLSFDPSTNSGGLSLCATF